MDTRSAAVAAACTALIDGELETAAAVIESDYPFVSPSNSGRSYTPRQMTSVFLRDGFIDRYSGERLVFPPVLRILSHQLPIAFPFQKNWKMSETHPAYWDLTPTIDHLVPVARGGDDAEHNWMTTSMARNAAKGPSSLEDIGWTLHPPGDLDDWDGLVGWLVAYASERPDLATLPYVSRWMKALDNQP